MKVATEIAHWMEAGLQAHARNITLLTCCLALLCWSSSALATDPPHDTSNLPNACDECHIAHNNPGMTLTTTAGNANLCMSCHAVHGMTWASGDQAIPHTSGTSHRWDATLEQSTYGAATPQDSSLASHVDDGGTLYCSTCHEQHSQNAAPFDPRAPSTAGEEGRHFQRIANNCNQMCLDCHRAWDMSDVTTYTGSNLSHPVDVTLPTTGNAFHQPPRETDGNAQVSVYSGTATDGGTTYLIDTNSTLTGTEGLYVRFNKGSTTRLIDSVTGSDQINWTGDVTGIGAGTTYEIDADGNISNNFVLNNGGTPSYTTGKVLCMSCHNVHYADSDSSTYDNSTAGGDGLLLRRSNNDDACIGCHRVLIHNSDNASTTYGTWGTTWTCRQCHQPHKTPNIYLVKESIETPNSGTKSVAVPSGNPSNDYIAGSPNYNGICEVCHTQTAYHRNDGSAGTAHYATTSCPTCHKHLNAFAHGGSGAGCDSCHGHDDGYGGGTYYGTTVSHSTHTDDDSDDIYGPAPLAGISCGTCHDTDNIPYFLSGTDSNGDGKYDLSETDVCDTCHSPSGSYDGVDDATIGAKNNWDNGVYTGSSLTSGKEKWCAGCHDEVGSVIQTVTAPNVIGDEDGSYTYGTGWGYYKTGHGLSASSTYPASGGVTAGAGVECGSCHDLSTTHIDGDARTFDDLDSGTTDPSVYREGYRLNQVGGLEPMGIPWLGSSGSSPPNTTDQYRLCAACHASGPFTSSSDMNTNFVTDGVNRHEYHLVQNNPRYPSDWDATNNSRMTCVSCHNVHGSTKLTMIRDGALTSREPGLMVWYNNDDIVTYSTSNPDPPIPEDLTLSASTGVVWRGATSANLCSHCHANNNTTPEYRTPYQDVTLAPVLSWTGETGYESDGVDPDSDLAETTFTFRVTFTDGNNDLPTTIQLWLDSNDDADFDDPGEKIDLTEASSEDPLTYDGKIYYTNQAIGQAGDNSFSYRYYASDGELASGDPNSTSQVVVTNNIPVVSWTGETGYVSDGVDPNTGGNGATFSFRATYQDLDDECPPTSSDMQIWIDEDDSGTYAESEKHDMSQADSNACSSGRIYAYSTTLAYVGDGALNYTFRASDGTDSAVEDAGPLSDNTVTVTLSTNNPPTLDWVSGTCRTYGVTPGTGADGSDFEFFVRYTDSDNECPTSGSADIQVWVDEDDSGTYEAGEKYNLTEDSGADTDCTDGKDYGRTLTLATAGDGDLNYVFYASDGADPASGSPASDQTVSVLNASSVCASGCDYTSIQTAVNAVNGTQTILVYDGTYGSVAFDGTNDNYTTLKSVCGAATTTMSGTGTVVDFQYNNTGSVVDGFTITGGTRGVGLNTAVATVQNSVITGNSNTSSGAGVYSTGSSSSITISNCEIYSNSAYNGGAFYFNNGTHTISSSIIRNNAATSGSGGAITFAWTGAATTVTDTIIKDNTATGAAAAAYFNGGIATFERCTITGNTANGTGGAIYATNSASNVSIENSVLAGNSGTQGGFIFINSGTTSFINDTFADNQATAGNGGAFFINCTTTTVRNSIFWANSASGTGQNIHKACGYYAYAGVFTDSDITTSGDYFTNGTWDSANNIDPAEDPLFQSASDYHIQTGSPAIDAANATYAPTDDIDGDARSDGFPDMGADEVMP